MDVLGKEEFYRILAAKSGITLEKSMKVLPIILREIAKGVVKDGFVTIQNFGVFSRWWHKGRFNKPPFGYQRPMWRPQFNPAAHLKDIVSELPELRPRNRHN